MDRCKTLNCSGVPVWVPEEPRFQGHFRCLLCGQVYMRDGRRFRRPPSASVKKRSFYQPGDRAEEAQECRQETGSMDMEGPKKRSKELNKNGRADSTAGRPGGNSGRRGRPRKAVSSEQLVVPAEIVSGIKLMRRRLAEEILRVVTQAVQGYLE